MSSPAGSEDPRVEDSTAPVAPPLGWRAAFQALTNRNFRLFLISMFFSSTGVWTQRIAQDWLVLELTNSPTQVGITTMLQFLPSLLFGLFGGVMADRHSKRRILICTQIGMTCLSSSLAVLAISHHVRVWEVFIVAFAVGTVFSFDLPTRQSFVNELVTKRQLRNAIGLNAAVFQVGALVGPAVSGALIDAVGPGYSFALTAIMYLAPMIALLRMNFVPPGPLAAPSGTERALTQLREGLRYVAQRPEILWTTVLIGTFGTFISNLPVTNAAFARLVFHSGPGGYGLLSSVVAAGSLLGALYGATRNKRPRLRTNLISAGALAALYILAAAMPGFSGYAAVLVAIGAATMILITSSNSIVQIAADPHVRGRVMGLYMLVFVGGGAIGGPLIGAIDQYAGPRAGILVSGLVPAAATCFIATMLARALHVRVRLTLGHGLPGLVSVGPATPTPAGHPDVLESVCCADAKCRVSEPPQVQPG